MPSSEILKQLTSTPDSLKYLYIMYYREGTRPNLTKIFYHKDPNAKTDHENFTSARNRADIHCHRMPSYRLSYVTPLVIDLDVDEKKFGIPPPPNPLMAVMGEK